MATLPVEAACVRFRACAAAPPFFREWPSSARVSPGPFLIVRSIATSIRMETLIGLRGPTFALVACDKYAHSSILRMKSDDDKLLVVDNNKVLGMAGQIGDRLQFGDYIEKNIHLFRFKHNRKLTCDAAANFTRQQLAYYLRRSPYHVDVLLAGHDEVRAWWWTPSPVL